jgi:hypothetical protein
VNNLATEKEFKTVKEELINKMEAELKNQSDPRIFGNGDIFHNYYYTWDLYRNLYDRMINKGEEIVPMWINASDIETDVID